ncbi:hypothetical protein F4680DRAFT_464336 [Xylaria scruposa]|nr:hypothetical protein F4680DRAFT_464336 [Xylaria scruposa]
MYIESPPTKHEFAQVKSIGTNITAAFILPHKLLSDYHLLLTKTHHHRIHILILGGGCIARSTTIDINPVTEYKISRLDKKCQQYNSTKIEPLYILGDKGPFATEVVLVSKTLPTSLENGNREQFRAWSRRLRGGENPSVRAPMLLDSNKKLSLLESSLIISHLLEDYDRDHRISFPRDSQWYFVAKQYHVFQVRCMERAVFAQSGVDCGWYIYEGFHKELEVLEGLLRVNQQGWPFRVFPNNGPWVVGDKMSYLDLVFCCWLTFIASFQPPPDMTKYPITCKWYDKMASIDWVGDTLKQSGFELFGCHGPEAE